MWLDNWRDNWQCDLRIDLIIACYITLIYKILCILIIQTLRKGATEQEKEEFLKEALLMSNFKYELILRLLGVCLDNDPQFIILELMEGGDLLSYLRSSRPTQVCITTNYTSQSMGR